jgi:hypothetical protein
LILKVFLCDRWGTKSPAEAKVTAFTSIDGQIAFGYISTAIVLTTMARLPTINRNNPAVHLTVDIATELSYIVTTAKLF